jgi:hypothetical protein
MVRLIPFAIEAAPLKRYAADEDDKRKRRNDIL